MSLVERVHALAGVRPIGWRRILEGGFTPAERWVVQLEGGSSVFAKVGVTELTAGWLRDEHRVYLQLQAGFMARMLGWDDDGANPILLLEDLSGGRWPPPWSVEDVQRVVGVLDDVRSSRPPGGLPSLESMRGDLASWSKVAYEPGSFLALGVCRRPWLDRALPSLIEADRAAGLAGDELLHLDVRSDNICFAGERTLMVDWNLACVGNAQLDRVAWITSLLLQWGRRAEKLAPDQPELAGLMAGYFADRARLPNIPDAPRVRGAQLDTLKVALPWAARLLGIPPPDGPALVKGR